MASMDKKISTSTTGSLTNWLLLTDFASKYRVSVSTLRRRIKAGTQTYRFEHGKYYLPDQFSGGYDEAPEFSPESVSPPAAQQTAPQAFEAKMAATQPSSPAAVLAASMKGNDEPLITTTSRLLNELKQAYTLILHEKEEQIVFLKEEVADLKTLVRVLESENARLNKDLAAVAPAPSPRPGPFGTA